VALVTGAGRGIGRATAEAFAAEGWSIVVAELRPALGRRTERALRRAGADTRFVATDVARPGSAERAVRTALARFGRLDCLVNNAGVVTPGPLARLPRPALDRMVDVNLKGALLVSRAAIPALARARGSIVNVASQLGKQGLGDYAAYCATKFGVVGLTQALAGELSPLGIRVWAVCPGLVDTQLARRAVGITGRERAGLIRPASVARAIVGLATGHRAAPSGAAVDVLR